MAGVSSSPDRAKCNVIALVALAAIAVFTATSALGIAPPRPGSGAVVPVVLQRDASVRPGLPHQSLPLTQQSNDKSATGVQPVLVIPGGFDDLAGSVSVSSLQALFDGPVRDYWLAASSGQYTLSGDVAPWRRAPRSRTYYAADDNGMDMWAAPHNAGRFVLDVVTAADQAGTDWGRYDNDGPDGKPNSGDDDGVVDALIVMHAGGGGECGTSALWSHCFFLAGWGYGRFETSSARHGGGHIEVNDYVLVPERSCDGGTIEIGIICHEFGHLLGLPDLYDTETGRAGIGGWGLMGTGSWGGNGNQPESPSLLSAWSRRELGWCTVEEVLVDGPVSLPAVQDNDRILLVRDPNQRDGEAWLVENRQRTGFDVSLPGEGLLIWHIDQHVIDETRHLNEVNAGTELGVALEQADGVRHLELFTGGNRGDSGDPWPGSSGARCFAAGTTPTTQDNLGAYTDVEFLGIMSPASTAYFIVVVGVVELDTTPPSVSVLRPSGGEEWTLGDMHTVAWMASDESGVESVELWLSRDGGTSFPTRLAHGLPAAGGWTGALSSVPGDAMVVQVLVHDEAGNENVATSGAFAIVDRYAPGVALTCAIVSGEELQPGTLVDVSWLTADNVGVVGVDLELSTDGGVTWSATEQVNQPAAAAVAWQVPDRGCTDAFLRAVARDAAGNLGWEESVGFAIYAATTSVPDVSPLTLGPCVPNPFNPLAEIRYAVSDTEPVTVTVHDLAGRRVRTLVDATRTAGPHRVVWDGRDGAGRAVASGVYYVRAANRRGQQALLKVTLVR